MNIWSHLIGFIYAIYASINYAIEVGFITITPLHNGTGIEYKPVEITCFGVFFASAAICLFLSTVYHWFCCLSPAHHDRLLLFDLTGVGLLVSSSYLPAVYLGFYCHPDLQTAYLYLSGAVLIVGLAAPWIDIKVLM